MIMYDKPCIYIGKPCFSNGIFLDLLVSSNDRLRVDFLVELLSFFPALTELCTTGCGSGVICSRFLNLRRSFWAGAEALDALSVTDAEACWDDRSGSGS